MRLGQQADLVVVAPPPPTCSPGPRTAWPTTCSPHPAHRPLPGACSRPAMHTEMWQHPATRANVATLRARGVVVLDPASGGSPAPTPARAGCPSPTRSSPAAAAARPPAPRRRRDLRGRTRGRVRRRHPRAARPGALPRQPLVAASRASRWPRRPPPAAPRSRSSPANIALPDPAGVDVVRGRRRPRSCARRCSSARRRRRRRGHGRGGRRLPARRRSPSTRSRRTTPAERRDRVELVRNPDILAEVVARATRPQPAQVIVGFAAETGDADGDVLDHARAKLARKGCDLLVVNDGRRGRGVRGRQTTRYRPDADGTVTARAARCRRTRWPTPSGTRRRAAALTR